MSTTPDRKNKKLLDAGREADGPKYDYQELEYGSGSTRRDPDDKANDATDEIRKSLKKIDAASKKEEIPEPGMDPF